MLANAAACSSGEIGADGSCVSQSALATKLQSLAGSNSESVSQWNWYVTNRLDPNAQIITTTTPAGSNSISAQTYVDLRQSMGIPDPNLTAAVSVGATPVDVPPQQPWGTVVTNPLGWNQFMLAMTAYSAAHPGMSGIYPTPSIQTQPGMAQIQPAKRNPWGRLPVAGGYIN